MNRIEKGKSQLKTFGIICLALGVILSVVGVVLILTCAISGSLNVVKLVVGIILLIIGIAGLGFGVNFTWVASALVATKGNIAEDNLGKGTVNMNKCTNCGEEVKKGEELCEKCKENLKP